ncbi:hypothetical protein GGX14DRAFT_388328 [Mycena pura]|uniref:Uncharacterized protein n=1 Tax=Mycena pura TaxID=153505 RepID=A0AAD7E132_9AGAR|nr:hypothetical protein GGX14DRAFT_388328 [Mycena pura]
MGKTGTDQSNIRDRRALPSGKRLSNIMEEERRGPRRYDDDDVMLRSDQEFSGLSQTTTSAVRMPHVHRFTVRAKGQPFLTRGSVLTPFNLWWLRWRLPAGQPLSFAQDSELTNFLLWVTPPGQLFSLSPTLPFALCWLLCVFGILVCIDATVVCARGRVGIKGYRGLGDGIEEHGKAGEVPEDGKGAGWRGMRMEGVDPGDGMPSAKV